MGFKAGTDPFRLLFGIYIYILFFNILRPPIKGDKNTILSLQRANYADYSHNIFTDAFIPGIFSIYRFNAASLL